MSESEGELGASALDCNSLWLVPGRLYSSKRVSVGCFPTPNLRTFIAELAEPYRPLLFLGYVRGENYNGGCYVLKFLTGENVVYIDIRNSRVLRRMDDEGR